MHTFCVTNNHTRTAKLKHGKVTLSLEAESVSIFTNTLCVHLESKKALLVPTQGHAKLLPISNIHSPFLFQHEGGAILPNMQDRPSQPIARISRPITAAVDAGKTAITRTSAHPVPPTVGSSLGPVSSRMVCPYMY